MQYLIRPLVALLANQPLRLPSANRKADAALGTTDKLGRGQQDVLPGLLLALRVDSDDTMGYCVPTVPSGPLEAVQH